MGQRPDSRETPALSALRQLLRELSEAGLSVAATGPAAFGLHRDVPLPPGHLTRLVGWGEGEARGRELVANSELSNTICLRWCPPEIARDAVAACRPEIAEAPIHPWTLVFEASGQVHDPEDALPAIEDKRLWLRQPPRPWLQRRPERVLHLAVWAAWTGLDPRGELLQVATRVAAAVLDLDRSTWHARFSELLMGWRPSVGLCFLQRARILPLMLPEVSAMVDFHKSCPVHHKDIWDHTLQVIDKCPPNLAVRWAALMHDTGKVMTRRVKQDGRVHFFGHESRGAALAAQAARRFEMPADLRDRVVFIISNHARANVYSTEWTDSAVRRLVRDMGPFLDDVISFSQSDYTTRRVRRILEVRALATELRERIQRVVERDAKEPPLPKGFGLLVIQETGRQGGPWLGRVQRWLVEQVEAGALEAGLPAQAYLRWVQRVRPELLTAPDPERPRRGR